MLVRWPRHRLRMRSLNVMKNKVIVLISTCSGMDQGRQLARELVTDGLAACVNLVPAVGSVYRWEGQIQEDQETLMVIKTAERRAGEVTAWLQEHHPYEVPEVVALPVVGGSDRYLRWVTDATTAGRPG